MIKGLIGRWFDGRNDTPRPVVAAFESAAGRIDLTAADISDVATQFGDMGPGLRIDFTADAHAHISELVAESQGQNLRFLICKAVVFEADAPATFPASMSIAVEGLGAAQWNAGILKGKRTC